MTKTIKSQTNSNKYQLTIDDETGIAVDCGCPDRFYRKHECKHMKSFNQQIAKDQAFAALMQKYDIREIERRDAERTAYLYFELAIGA